MLAIFTATLTAAFAHAQGTIPPLQLKLATERGVLPIYQRGDSLVLHVTPSRDAYVYCFYRQHDGQVIRLFPNRFHPAALIRGGQTVKIPEDPTTFTLPFLSAPAAEQIDCYGTGTDPKSKIPSNRLGVDLTPSRGLSLQSLRTTFTDAGFDTFVASNIVLAVSE